MGLKTNRFISIFDPVIIIPSFVKLGPARLKMKYADGHKEGDDHYSGCVQVVQIVKECKIIGRYIGIKYVCGEYVGKSISKLQIDVGYYMFP
jgi:hypothetical protein